MSVLQAYRFRHGKHSAIVAARSRLAARSFAMARLRDTVDPEACCSRGRIAVSREPEHRAWAVMAWHGAIRDAFDPN